MFGVLIAVTPPAYAAETFDALAASIEAANQGVRRIVTLEADITLSAALPPITGEISIDGAGYGISGAGEQRIFDVNGGALTLENVTVTAGKAEQGGAIRLRNGAQVVIENTTFSDNRATDGAAIATSSISDRLTIRGSRFTGNIAEKSGGAIYARGARVNISGSHFERNCGLYAFFRLVSESGENSESHSFDSNGCFRTIFFRNFTDASVQYGVEGGAIRLASGARVNIEASTFIDNRATVGGAIANTSADVRLTVNSSSFINNRASLVGGGFGGATGLGGTASITNSSFEGNTVERGSGGAIGANALTLDIINSTFSENGAEYGGAIRIDEQSDATITHATFVANWSQHEGDAIRKTGGKLSLRNSIVHNSGSAEDCVGSAEHVGNLSVDGTCGDRPSDDPLLDEKTGSPAYYPPRRLQPGG